MSPVATVYLTDGFDRLDLPGQQSDFTLDRDWVIHGTSCVWIWPHRQPATVAGAEGFLFVQGDLMQVEFEGVEPKVVRHGQEIRFTPSVRFTELGVQIS